MQSLLHESAAATIDLRSIRSEIDAFAVRAHKHLLQTVQNSESPPAAAGKYRHFVCLVCGTVTIALILLCCVDGLICLIYRFEACFDSLHWTLLQAICAYEKRRAPDTPFVALFPSLPQLITRLIAIDSVVALSNTALPGGSLPATSVSSHPLQMRPPPPPPPPPPLLPTATAVTVPTSAAASVTAAVVTATGAGAAAAAVSDTKSIPVPVVTSHPLTVLGRAVPPAVVSDPRAAASNCELLCYILTESLVPSARVDAIAAYVRGENGSPKSLAFALRINQWVESCLHCVFKDYTQSVQSIWYVVVTCRLAICCGSIG